MTYHVYSIRRSRVHECKALGELLIILIIKPAGRYLQPSDIYAYIYITGTTWTFLYNKALICSCGGQTDTNIIQNLPFLKSFFNTFYNVFGMNFIAGGTALL